MNDLPCYGPRLWNPVHFAKAADQSCRLEEGCSSARRAPSSYNGSSSFPQQSAGYALGLMKAKRGKGGCGMWEHGRIATDLKTVGGDRLSHRLR